MTIKEQLAEIQTEAEKPNTDEQKVKTLALKLASDLILNPVITLDDFSVLSPEMLKIALGGMLLALIQTPPIHK